MKLEDFNYELPEELIAQFPAENRDESRMIVLDRRSEEVRETRFSNFPRYLSVGDLLVINETKVIPARLVGRKSSGAEIEIFLAQRLGEGRWRALCRPSKRLHPGDAVSIGGAGREVTVIEEEGGGEWIVQLPEGVPEREFLSSYGSTPLPPYIKRNADARDAERYQTVFARNEGSVAAPTAGLHFTEKVLRDIERKGSTIVPLTLHVGPGTFRPLADETVENNTLQPEFLMMRKDHWDEVRDAKSSGRGILAVGTTATRALEALASGRIKNEKTIVIDGSEYLTGWTDLFIYPGFRFRIVDSLLTNMHLPRSSLFVMVSAFTGRERLLKTYKWAVQRRFRFYSYGDVMLIR